MISDADYDYLQQLLRDRSGLDLGVGKAYLLESRLLPIARSYGFDAVGPLVGMLRTGTHPSLEAAIADAMTTNETLFFRDGTPFDDLVNTLLPELIAKRSPRRELSIWSAACSTGQEPYSLLMTIEERCPQLAGWNIDLWATDYSPRVLGTAREGIYSQFEVQRGLKIQQLMKFFKQVETGWQIRDEFRSKIRFRQWNLLDPFNRLPKFDIILCRNVLIYFDAETKREILLRLGKQLAPGGSLILGSAETTLGLAEEFARDTRCGASVYHYRGEAALKLTSTTSAFGIGTAAPKFS